MNTIKMNLATLLTLAMLISGIVTTYFTGLAQSKDYTDTKVNASVQQIQADQKEIKENQVQMQVDMAVMKEILIAKYGKPKDR